MPNYRRWRSAGGCYFFTVAALDRRSAILTHHIDQLRALFQKIRAQHPFEGEAIVVLPDHLHCVWTLPVGDDNFSTRWRLIKSDFSRALPAHEPKSRSRSKKGERGFWQRRFWEHVIRDEKGLRAACGLHSLQSCQTWICGAPCRLAVLIVSLIRESRCLCG